MSRPDAGKRNGNNSPDTAAAQLAAGQWGVLDNDELRACGLSAAAVMRRRRRGVLHLVHPGVYSLGHDGLSLKARFLAATKASGGVLSHRSAAVMWNLFPWDEAWLPEVTVSTKHTRNIPGIVVHRTRRPFKVVRFDHIPVTTPARALIDVSPVLPFKPLRRAVREGMALNRVTLKELIGGSASLRRIVADGHVPTENEFEDAVLDLIDQGGFTRPDVRKLIVVGGERTVPDFRWPQQRLIVEADGAQWHDHRLAREDDATRQARLEAAGERLVRVTWKQSIDQPQQTITRLRTAGAPGSVR